MPPSFANYELSLYKALCVGDNKISIPLGKCQSEWLLDLMVRICLVLYPFFKKHLSPLVQWLDFPAFCRCAGPLLLPLSGQWLCYLPTIPTLRENFHLSIQSSPKFCDSFLFPKYLHPILHFSTFRSRSLCLFLGLLTL